MNQFPKKENKYDLEERTAKFGGRIVKLCKELKGDSLIQPLLIQLIRSGTSVGANYMEANGASSKKDFRNKIFISKKEIQESKHWLRLIDEYTESKIEEVSFLRQEAQELTLIFQKITSSLDKNDN
jgi:four helix bundle protein